MGEPCVPSRATLVLIMWSPLALSVIHSPPTWGHTLSQIAGMTWVLLFPFYKRPPWGSPGAKLKARIVCYFRDTCPTLGGGPTLMRGRRSTSQGRRLQRRLSCSGQHRGLTLEMRVETPRPQLVEQGLQGLV